MATAAVIVQISYDGQILAINVNDVTEDKLCLAFGVSPARIHFVYHLV